MEEIFVDSSDSTAGVMLIVAVVVVIIAIFYFRKEQFEEPDKSFDEIMDEEDPGLKRALNETRIKRQDLESQITEIDNRLKEIREVGLGGHSAAYYTRELNELTEKRIPIANKLDIVKQKEKELGLEAADFTDAVLQKTFDEKYGN